VPAPPPPAALRKSTTHPLPGTENSVMSKKLQVVLIITAIAALVSASALLAQGPNPRTEVWAGCELYDTIVTKATFKPDHGNFDELYAGATYQNGVGLISDAAPGYGDFNGGRWHLNVLKSGVDPGKYSSACTVDDLDPGDFESTDQYFECPLMPRKTR
jgi:hypothetical protein